ncbi:mannosylfructose-phosphate synthase [Clostridium tepidiprofundi DSM 19306]|uniref:Mannosylfructose-phosphate synthase n=1 Tax=Clostridium tepidiprofundi DSM 19306 TaxID=1121338 RepID=A0A151B4X2_9CLOT|nr:glycosyltransferase family 1 protein [Clostridium tepidiprofundi]KYH34949.1 mannosylfructose-phosphate synthase [Clostridium tepidiprofundi DSM 19306]
MKIGIDSRAAAWYRGTGIGTYSYQLIKSLNEIDCINNYVLYLPKTCNSNVSFKNNFRIKHIEYKRNNNFWIDVNNTINILNDSLDIFHVPQNGIGLCYNKNCRYVITLHDIIPAKMPETVSDTYLEIFKKEMSKIIPLCDGIITVSNYSKEDISKEFNFPKEKIFVTYLASEEIYKPLNIALSKKIIKKYHGISEDYILYIGGFSPRKNILGLLDAFNILKHKYKSQIKLIIAGKKGKSYYIYKKRVEKLHLENDVIFTGFIPMKHIPYLYNASKLFVYPSFYEGFGLPPLEAMACGIPVIASNTTSIPEILKDSALYIDPYNIDDMYKKIYRALVDNKLRSELIKKGFKRVSELSWKKTAVETLNAYKKIVQQ